MTTRRDDDADTILVSYVPFVLSRIIGDLASVERQLRCYWPHSVIIENGAIVSCHRDATVRVLADFGFSVRRYRPSAHTTVGAWADWSRRIPDPVILSIWAHSLLTWGGIVYDTAVPRGCPARHHPDRAAKVHLALRVRRYPNAA